MARRIEIELTSARPDGTWTWRAAGALNPKGSLQGSLLYEGAKAGDVVRAEADFGMEGISVVSVEPPRAAQANDPNRIELLEKPVNATVTTQLAARPRTGERRQGGRTGDRPPRGDRPERADRGPRPDRGDVERAPRPERGGRPPRPAAGSARPGPRPGAGTPEEQAPGGGTRPVSERVARSDDARQNRRGAGGSARPQTAPGRQRRLAVGNSHRNAMLESLPAEQRPIAQQLLRGGIPQVRTALFLEREKAREEGRPEPSTDGVLAIAESLVGRVKAAEWRDRAEAAVKAGDELSTRDLRLLVNGSEVARDEASRELVVALREALERRVEAHREEWSKDVSRLLDEGHTLRAVRLSSRPPDPGARFSAELATRLRDAAGSALSPSVPSDKWLAMLQAISESPVRRAVKPVGLPEDQSPELLETARQQCGRVPGLAPLLGLSVPPPPPPTGKTTAPVRAARRPARGPRTGAERGPAKGTGRKTGKIREATNPQGTADATGAQEATVAKDELSRPVPSEDQPAGAQETATEAQPAPAAETVTSAEADREARVEAEPAAQAEAEPHAQEAAEPAAQAKAETVVQPGTSDAGTATVDTGPPDGTGDSEAGA